MSEAGTDLSESPPVEEEGDSETGASDARKRGRPRVDNKKARKSRSKVRHVVPCYVDMGVFTKEFAIRYDAGQQLYDLADVMNAAYSGRASSVRRTIAKLNKMGAFKKGGALWLAQGWQADTDFAKVKWAAADDDARSKGDGRKACSHKVMPFLLQKSAGRRAGMLVNAIACWIKRTDPDSQTFLDTIEMRTPEGAVVVERES